MCLRQRQECDSNRQEPTAAAVACAVCVRVSLGAVYVVGNCQKDNLVRLRERESRGTNGWFIELGHLPVSKWE